MQILNINIGQPGIKIGNCFWKNLHTQHFSTQQPQGHPEYFFSKSQTIQQPRAILLATTQTDLKPIHHQSFQYKPQNVLISSQLPYALYGEGRYYMGQNFKESVEDRIRKEVELCDRLGGFIVMSALGGGSGSGLTASVASFLREKYCSNIVQSFRLLPQLDIYSHPVEIYNSTFAIHYEVQLSDLTLMFDNSACIKQLAATGNLNPTMDAINHKLGSVIADISIPFRYKGNLNTSQRKICSNLVMFPRMHFVPFLRSPNNCMFPIESALSPKNCFLSNCLDNSPDSCYFNLYAGVRTHRAYEGEVVPRIRSQFERRQLKFVDWIGDNIHVSLHEPIGGEHSTVLLNSYHIREVFKRIGDKFTSSFRRKAFVHSYIQASGMDQMEFTEAESNLNDLTSQYQPPNYGYAEDEEWSENQSNLS